MSLKRIGAVFAVAILCSISNAKDAQLPPGTLPPDCDRSCLYGVLDKYLDALAHRDPARLPWAPNARYTENNVELAVGDGVWATVTKLGGDYKMRFADTQNGQVGYYGLV